MAAPKVVFEKIAALEVPFHAHAPNDHFFDEDARVFAAMIDEGA